MCNAMGNDDARMRQIQAFLARCTGREDAAITPLAGDASFRRYWRVRAGDDRYVLMDAPPQHEDVRPFLRVGGLLVEAGIHVPAVYCADRASGLILLEDLGDTLYLDALDEDSADALYGQALETLARIAAVPAWTLDPYDRARLLEEMALFPTWFLERHLGLELDKTQSAVLERAFESLIGVALAQPQVFVHRGPRPGSPPRRGGCGS
jgi:aminoglycoside/choline kinase family phosphotransferase